MQSRTKSIPACLINVERKVLLVSSLMAEGNRTHVRAQINAACHVRSAKALTEVEVDFGDGGHSLLGAHGCCSLDQVDACEIDWWKVEVLGRIQLCLRSPLINCQDINYESRLVPEFDDALVLTKQFKVERDRTGSESGTIS